MTFWNFSFPPCWSKETTHWEGMPTKIAERKVRRSQDSFWICWFEWNCKKHRVPADRTCHKLPKENAFRRIYQFPSHVLKIVDPIRFSHLPGHSNQPPVGDVSQLRLRRFLWRGLQTQRQGIEIWALPGTPYEHMFLAQGLPGEHERWWSMMKIQLRIPTRSRSVSSGLISMDILCVVLQAAI